MPTLSLFISHTHSDKSLADAVGALVEAVFGDRLIVQYSTSNDLAGGVPSGAVWFEWIGKAVKESAAAFILLTPSSIHKPWVLWEAGAVYGAFLAGGKSSTPVRPLLYGISPDDVPPPLQGFESVRNAGDPEAIRRVLEELITRDYKTLFTLEEIPRAIRRLESASQTYHRSVKAVRLQNLLDPACLHLTDLMTGLEIRALSENPFFERLLG